MRLDMDADDGIAQLQKGMLDTVANVMGIVDPHVPGYDQMKLYERHVARSTRPDVVRLDGACGLVGYDLTQIGHGFGVGLFVHETADRTPHHPISRAQDVECDQRRHERIKG